MESMQTALATGQDFRAIDCIMPTLQGWAYRSLTKWYKTRKGDLVGELELPIAVGIVGGATSVNPISKIGLKILGVKTAKELLDGFISRRTCTEPGCSQSISLRRYTERSYEITC